MLRLIGLWVWSAKRGRPKKFESVASCMVLVELHNAIQHCFRNIFVKQSLKKKRSLFRLIIRPTSYPKHRSKCFRTYVRICIPKMPVLIYLIRKNGSVMLLQIAFQVETKLKLPILYLRQPKFQSNTNIGFNEKTRPMSTKGPKNGGLSRHENRRVFVGRLQLRFSCNRQGIESD